MKGNGREQDRKVARERLDAHLAVELSVEFALTVRLPIDQNRS